MKGTCVSLSGARPAPALLSQWTAKTLRRRNRASFNRCQSPDGLLAATPSCDRLAIAALLPPFFPGRCRVNQSKFRAQCFLQRVPRRLGLVSQALARKSRNFRKAPYPLAPLPLLPLPSLPLRYRSASAFPAIGTRLCLINLRQSNTHRRVLGKVHIA